ncbi:MAG: GNAT family N-acetyltransferase [Burkholderiaceae bacterium]|nr:GNAT family N-acetyltransferase [Burkholderiaceae bacterium]
MTRLVIRNTQARDARALVELQARVYPQIDPWTEARVLHQLGVFPQGQVVACFGDRVVGCASSLIVRWDEWDSRHSWGEITANGSFDNHDPEGRTLYGAEVFVDPRLRGRRVGHQLYEARRTICRRMNLRRIIACGRLPGYHRYADRMTIDTYVKKVLWGDISDPVLGFQLKEGFRYCGIVENYIPQDIESGGNASLIVWLNPHYDPNRPTTNTDQGGNQ